MFVVRTSADDVAKLVSHSKPTMYSLSDTTFQAKTFEENWLTNFLANADEVNPPVPRPRFVEAIPATCHLFRHDNSAIINFEAQKLHF